MDFPRQCKRFLNYRVFTSASLGGGGGGGGSSKVFSNISAVAVFRTGPTASSSIRIVFADNDSRCLYLMNESDGKIIKEVRTIYFNLIFSQFEIFENFSSKRL